MRIETLANALSSVKATGTPSIPGGLFGELLESRLLPDYHYLVKNGFVYSASIAAINPSAFVGGAAGTPIFGLYNPANSGKDLVLLEAVVGIRTTGTAAVSEDFNHWGVNQNGVAVTGTVTAPRNLYSMAASGSVAISMVNTANTAALASNLIRPSFSVGLTAATAITNVTLLRDEIKGGIIVSPGTYYAFGLAAALTAGSIDAGLIWAEMPA